MRACSLKAGRSNVAAFFYFNTSLRDLSSRDLPINVRARWKLGRVLAKMERGHGPGRGKKKVPNDPSFIGFLKEIGLDKKAAIIAQRIGALR